MRFFLLIFILSYFAAADKGINFPSKSNFSLTGDSLVSITEFGASPANDDNTEAFREAFTSWR